MKSFSPGSSFPFLSVFLYSCQNEGNLTPAGGKVRFSLSPQASDDGLVTETTTPVLVLLSIKGCNDKVQETTYKSHDQTLPHQSKLNFYYE
jgi:hypothetical protein